MRVRMPSLTFSGLRVRLVRRLGELEQVGGGVLLELQRPGDGQQHLVRRVPVAALLQADVVVGADPGEEGDLLAAQARDTAVALAGHSGGVGAHERSADAQVPAQGVGICGDWHASRLNTACYRPGGPGTPSVDRSWSISSG